MRWGIVGVVLFVVGGGVLLIETLLLFPLAPVPSSRIAREEGASGRGKASDFNRNSTS